MFQVLEKYNSSSQKKLSFAIGIPTINRADLLVDALKQYQNSFLTTRIFIIDNGQQNLFELFKQEKISLKNITIHVSPKNVGVAESWNMLCSKIFQRGYEYALILNDDIIIEQEENAISDFLKQNQFGFISQNFSAFLIKEKTFEKVGTFDAGFYPAYYEDNDYLYRLKLLAIETVNSEVLNAKVWRESESIKKDPGLNVNFEKNKNRYLLKWGGLPGEEKYTTPFNTAAKSKLGLSLSSLLYVGPAGTTGYAEAAKNYLLALGENYKIQWSPTYYSDSLTNRTHKDAIIETYIHPITNPNVLLLHDTADKWEYLKNKYDTSSVKKRIGITVWETDQLHPDWVKHCNQSWLDEIWVPVQWNKSVFEKSGVTTPIKVVPHIFHEPGLNKENQTYSTINHQLPKDLYNDFIFYTIGQWNTRKGITETIHAFCKAFTKNDKVTLLVKTFWAQYSAAHKNQCEQKLASILCQYPNPPRVVLLTNHFSRQEMLALHRRCHAYVSLCKSEGWGLGAFDAAALGNPVIITGYGGQVEFLPPDYPYLVKYDVENVSGMSYIAWYSSNQKWANPNIDDAVEKMRLLFDKNQRAKDKELSQHILRSFSKDSIDWKSLI